MTVLRYDTKKSIREQLVRLIKNVRPEDAGVFFNHRVEYPKAIMAYLRENRDALSGESFEFRNKATASVASHGKMMKKGQTPAGGKIPYNVAHGDRIDLGKLDRGDWRWLENTVRKLSAEIRFKVPETPEGGYILSESDKTWSGWSTSDCFFCALLAVLGLRFKGDSRKVKETEQDIEGTLATQLGLPMKLVQDETLIWVVEKRLGWEKVSSANTKATLEAKAETGSTYLVSYCSNAETDFWHVVLCDRLPRGWEVRDRQQERNGKKGALPSHDCELVAWKVDRDSDGVKKLRRDMNIDALAGTHADNLA